MRFLVVLALSFYATASHACDRTSAEDLVKASIAQGLLPDEQIRTLKMGTVMDDAKDERIVAVHTVMELEKFGRKVSEQSIVFRIDEECRMISSTGAVIKKVQL